jgi:hypothetical protein
MTSATIYTFPMRDQEHEWEVIRLRRRGEYLGTVRAADEAAALKAAVKAFAPKSLFEQKQLLIRRA